MFIPLRVTHVVLTLEIGGLERMVLSLIREGRRRGQQVSVLCVEKPGRLADEARAAGAEVVSLNKPVGRFTEYIGHASAVLEQLRPDIVHTHQIGAAWYVGPGAAKRGTPILHTEHGNHFARARGWVDQLKTRLFYLRAARWIGRFCCVSAEIAAAARRWGTVPRRVVEVVPNGIDTTATEGLPLAEEVRRVIGIPPSAIVIGTVGRLAEVKRQDRLLQAAAVLRKRYPDLRILIVGDGPERSNLERSAVDLGVAEITHFVGFQPMPELYLRAMDVFALTSRSEGFPVAILEAWAVGVPVVSTAVGGIPDVVSNEENGLLVPPENADSLLMALSQPLTDSDLREKLIVSGAETVRRRYSVQSVAAKYERMYRELTARRER